MFPLTLYVFWGYYLHYFGKYFWADRVYAGIWNFKISKNDCPKRNTLKNATSEIFLLRSAMQLHWIYKCKMTLYLQLSLNSTSVKRWPSDLETRVLIRSWTFFFIDLKFKFLESIRSVFLFLLHPDDCIGISHVLLY